MTDEERAELIRHIVDQAPPLTPEQGVTIRSLLRRDDPDGDGPVPAAS